MSFAKWFIRSNYAQFRFRSGNFFSLKRAINFLTALYELGNGEYVLYIRLYFSGVNFPFSFVSGKYAIRHRALVLSCMYIHTRQDKCCCDDFGSMWVVNTKCRRCLKINNNIRRFLICRIKCFLQLHNCENCGLAIFYKIQFWIKIQLFWVIQNCRNLQG